MRIDSAEEVSQSIKLTVPPPHLLPLTLAVLLGLGQNTRLCSICRVSTCQATRNLQGDNRKCYQTRPIKMKQVGLEVQLLSNGQIMLGS